MTSILFRQGNVVVALTYGGVDYRRTGPDGADIEARQVPEPVTFAGAVRAAHDVAHGMHLTATAPARITVVTEHPERPITRVPTACDMLPTGLANRLGKGGLPSPHTSSLIEYGTTSYAGSCEWDFYLQVDVAVLTDSRHGTGERVAARQYLSLYYQARGATGDIPDAETFVRPLTRPGQRAYISWVKDTESDAQVVFRVRNVLVRVECSDVEKDGYSKREALTDAYDAAVAAARTVHT